MASAHTGGWILTFIFLGAACLLGDPQETLTQIRKTHPDRATGLSERLTKPLPREPLPATVELCDKAAVALLLAWERALLHPWGGGAYVLVTLVGPTLLGVPDLIPKGWIWAMVSLISAASIYGVHRTSRDDARREDRIVSRIRKDNDAKEERNRAEERENADLRKFEEIERREIEALKRRPAGSSTESPNISF